MLYWNQFSNARSLLADTTSMFGMKEAHGSAWKVHVCIQKSKGGGEKGGGGVGRCMWGWEEGGKCSTFAKGSGVDELMGINASNGAASHIAYVIHTCTHHRQTLELI